MKGGKSKADTSKKADAKLSVKRKAAETVSKPVKKGKAGKDPNKSKRPPSAFFIFMEEFRKQFKEKNPNNKQVSVFGKAAGAKWKSMSAAEKAPYEAKATKRKAEYNKTLDAYNKQSDGAGKKSVEEEEESDKSKSEVHDEDDEESGEPARMEELRITKPDDWHLHLRDGDLLQAVAPHSASHFGRAIVMPNLKPPVTTTAAAVAYRERILRALPPDCGFEPLMTLYLTDNTSPREIELARRSGVVYAVKLYPAGATTNSQDGVTDIFGKCLPVLEQMIDHNMPLLVHGEVTDPNVDTFDREKVFIETILAPLVHRLPQLKIVMEHITTMDAVNFVESCTKGSVAATVTPQHLLLNRNSLFQGGLQPHNYCLPVLKRETHRQAIVAAVTSGSRRFFLGTDSAPHERRRKECSCGCAGIYSAPVALSLYAKVFEQAGALDKLEAFVSFNGPDFYGLPKNTSKVVLKKIPWRVPKFYKLASGEIIPMFGGQTLDWLPFAIE